MIEPKRPEGSDPEAIWFKWAHDELRRLEPIAVQGQFMGRTARGNYRIETPSSRGRKIRSVLFWDGVFPMGSGASGISFSVPDNFGTSSTGFPYGNAVDVFHPEKGKWPPGTSVTCTVPQDGSVGRRFYGFDINPGEINPGPGITFGLQPDSGQVYTADQDYIGSNPVFTMTPDPDAYATLSGALNFVCRYKIRYVTTSGDGPDPGLDGHKFHDLGGSDPQWGYGDYRIGPPTLLVPYDWTLSGPLGFLYGKVGGTNILGDYELVSGGSNPTITVLSGGFDTYPNDNGEIP